MRRIRAPRSDRPARGCSVSSGGRPLGRTRVRLVNCDGPHLHSDSNMRRTALGEDVAGEMVAPHQQRHFQFDPRQRLLAMDDDVIRARDSRSRGADRLRTRRRCRRTRSGRCRGDASRDRAGRRRLDRARRNRARAAPCRCRRTCGRIDRTELAAGDEVAHAHEMRLEAVIVGGIANDAVAARERLERRRFRFVASPTTASRPARACHCSMQ